MLLDGELLRVVDEEPNRVAVAVAAERDAVALDDLRGRVRVGGGDREPQRPVEVRQGLRRLTGAALGVHRNRRADPRRGASGGIGSEDRVPQHALHPLGHAATVGVRGEDHDPAVAGPLVDAHGRARDRLRVVDVPGGEPIVLVRARVDDRRGGRIGLRDQVVVEQHPREIAHRVGQRARGIDPRAQQRSGNVGRREVQPGGRQPEQRGESRAPAAVAHVAAAAVDPVDQRAPALRLQQLEASRRARAGRDQHVDVGEGAVGDVPGAQLCVREPPPVVEQPPRALVGLVGEGPLRLEEQRDPRRSRGRAGGRRLGHGGRDRRGRLELLSRHPAVEVRQQREAPAAQAEGEQRRHVGVLVQHRLDPVLLRLGHRDPVRAGRENARRGIAAVGAEVGHLQGRVEPVDRHVHPLEAADQAAQLGLLVGLRREEVVPQRPPVDLHPRLALRVEVPAVALEQPDLPLPHGLREDLVQLVEEPLLVRGRLRDRDPLDHEVLGRPALDRRAVVDLDRHTGALEAHRTEGVAELRGEEVVDAAVEEVPPALDELRGERGPVEILDPRDHGLVGLVVLRVVVRREERAEEPELVVVEEQQRRVAPEQLHAGVGLRLRAHVGVAVQVEAVDVATLIERPAVGVLYRQEDHDRVAQHVADHAVLAVGELVERLQRGVGAALFAAVDVRRDPQDRGRARRELGHLGVGRARVADLRGRRTDRGQAGRGHVLGPADDRVANRASLPRRSQRVGDHARAGRGDRVEVSVGLLHRHLAVDADVEPEHLVGARDHAHELGRGVEHVAAPAGPRLRRQRERRGGGRDGRRLQEAAARERCVRVRGRLGHRRLPLLGPFGLPFRWVGLARWPAQSDPRARAASPTRSLLGKGPKD